MHSIKSELATRLFLLVQKDDFHQLSEFFSTHQDSHTLKILQETINQLDEATHANSLHVSSSKLNHESVKLLLEHGADPNLKNGEGQTSTVLIIRRIKECCCEICTRNAVRCIDALGDHNADFGLLDKTGFSALYLAAQYQSLECATALLRNGAPIESYRRKRHFRGKHQSILTILFEKLPSIVLNVFDRAVTIQGSKNIHDPDCEVVFDLSVILPTKVMESYHSCKSQDETSVDPKNQVHPFETNGNSKFEKSVTSVESDSDEKYRPVREMGFLNDLLESRNSDTKTYRAILRHPLVSVFTDIKWNSLELLFIGFIFMQIGVLIAYTTFLFITIFFDCPYDVYQHIRYNIDTFDKNNAHKVKIGPRLPTTEQLCEMQLASKVISGYVVTCVSAVLVKEVQHAIMDFREYVSDLLNYVQLLGLGSIMWTVVIAWDSTSIIYPWLYPMAAFGIAISWCQLFIQIGRFPKCAIYIDMFTKIFINFCWSLTIYSFILVGFAMSYCVLFPSAPNIVDIPLALVKVLTMMAGELDYDSLFMREETHSENTTLDEKHKFSLAYPISAHLWYVAFVIMVTLVLMNLLVGLAVSDIQGCRKDAEIVVMKRRIRYTCYLEKSFFLVTEFLPTFLKDYLRMKITLIKPSHEKTLSCLRFNKLRIENCRLTIRPNDPHDKMLSEESKHAIKYWLSHQRSPMITRQVCKFGSKKSVHQIVNDPENLDNNPEQISKIIPDLEAVSDKKIYDVGFVEKALGSQIPSGSANDFSIKRMERRLADLDHKLDILINQQLMRRKSSE